MTLLPRLEKAARTLTGKERVVLFLQARNAGRGPEVDIKNFTDPRERRQYDRYMGVVYVANAELGMLLEVISRQVEWIAQDRLLFEIVSSAAEQAADHEKTPIDWKRAKALPKSKPVNIAMYLANLAEQARAIASDMVMTRWKELRALEAVWAVMAADFDGEDPVDPALRNLAQQAREALLALAERCGIRKLPEPEQELIDEVWLMVDQAYDTLKLVKEEP